ncbi:hypothetical protein D7V67_15665 [Clostridium paraputrificum]|uniref:hypothetical protein n=1 Tax=Clostridium paraputrificum TaxID=29363 RepID=UPI000EA26FD2|nr:hypothetical protein [Clostridium paraputrificum]RKI45676.1 hypothetical protein D7V67_15665 [Clostridium paraputrificum]
MKSTEVLTTVIDGLPINEKANVVVTHNDSEIVINEVKIGLFKKDIVKTFRIKFENVLDVIVASKKEIIEKNKSVIGRGATGALLFGPVGAIIGGMSGIGKKQKRIKKGPYLVISYKNRDGEIGNITFDAESSLVKLTAKSFEIEIKKIIKSNSSILTTVSDIEL